MMRLLVPVLALMLAACAKEPAAYLIAGNDVAITLERIQPYFWSTGWELDVILRQHPSCQRRHHLKPTASAKVKVEVYSPEPAIYILRQGKRWYVAELRSCGFDAFKEPPPEPGELRGAFQEKDGVFTFVERKDKAAKANGGEAE
ncbi:MAG: hypothetical protein IPP18_10045 [Rhodocyclaceae bacterium]|nr:hypothetical protein [Rhodocyclaceae bacterium]